MAGPLRTVTTWMALGALLGCASEGDVAGDEVVVQDSELRITTPFGTLATGSDAIGQGTDKDDVLVGTEGPDPLDGRQGNDRLFGLGGDDVLLGSEGDDWLFGGPGDDHLTGGPGIDTAFYPGLRVEYDITAQDELSIIRGRSGWRLFGDGSDRLTQVEYAVFGDGTQIALAPWPTVSLRTPSSLVLLEDSEASLGDFTLGGACQFAERAASTSGQPS